jgi:predicted glutamine amidotransferase
VRTRRRSHDGTVLETPWSERRSAIFVASEKITDEPWQQVDEGMLIRIERLPVPHWRLVAH